MTATQEVVDAAAPWVERLARFGYAAKGVVYLTVGGLVAVAGLNRRGTGGEDQHSAFAFIRDAPFGRVLLIILAIGLAGYALWRLVSGFADSEDRGSDAKGLAIRAGSIGRGLIYTGFAVEVLRLATKGGQQSSGSEAKAQHWTARAMDAPFGHALVWAVAIGVVIYGAYQLYAGWKSKLSKRIALGQMNPSVRRRAIAISRFGIAARGIVFIIIGGSLATAAARHNPQEAHGTSGALRELASQPFGNAMLAIIGFGLAAYGVYALVNARYRRLNM